MLKSREEARSLREMLSFTKKKEDDPLLEYRLRFRQRIGQARQRLTDAEKTAFFFVTLLEALPIAVITRFIGWFHDFGIPVGGVVVNMVLDRPALGADVPEFVRNRVAMQDEHMQTIGEKFDGTVRAVVPLFDQKVRGFAMLRRAGEALFGEAGSSA
jgi:arsenite/tail-anchored protein-transporting ATPase